MNSKESFSPKVIALDTGGTMTDSFLIDENGHFTVGKAQTTPYDESIGIQKSINDSLEYRKTDLNQSGKNVEAFTYSGTAMLNRLLEREGNSNIGVITTMGFEDLHRLGRALQGWIYLDYAGRLHAREHHHPEPLISRENIKGVRGRINFWGEEIVPIYKKDIEKVINEFVEMDVDSICVCLLFSYLNPRHEKQVERTAKKIMKKKGKSIPIYLSCEHNPIRGETPRLNALIIEQYAAEPSRKQLIQIAERMQEQGIPVPLRILTSYGGTISPYHHTLIPSMMSGPIGGMIGTKVIADIYDLENLVASDVGGTSFDVGLQMKNYVPTKWESSLGRYILNIPMIAIDSIGAGTGMYVRHNRITSRLEFGPDSAGYKVGVCNKQADVETVTMTDCSLVLGYLNEDNFLGGKVPLNKEIALNAIEEQLSDPLNSDPYTTARGALDLIELNMKNHLNGMIQGLGFRPENYTLLAYGGGGPLHVSGYAGELGFQDILIPEWSAAFSAYGCACADHAYRHEKSIDLAKTPDGSMDQTVIMMLNATWADLKKNIIKEFKKEGRNAEEIKFRFSIRLQYLGMLDDLEVESDTEKVDLQSFEKLTRNYDDLFEKIYKRGAKSPELGYHITKAIVEGIVPVPKPKLLEREINGEDPEDSALKGTRKIYWEENWYNANIWEMNKLHSGNVVMGPAVIEAPATTLLVPPNFKTFLDKYRIFHMEVLDK
jgi:N-methylhydantoinase A/oxoprolinase/acetone carboxylase beta subunit